MWFPTKKPKNLKELRKLSKNGCLLQKKKFSNNGCLFLEKLRKISLQKRLFLIRTVSYDRSTPVCNAVGIPAPFSVNSAMQVFLRKVQVFGMERKTSTRWSTTLSSKVNLAHAIDLKALCGAIWATLPSKIRVVETLEVHRVVGHKSPYRPRISRTHSPKTQTPATEPHIPYPTPQTSTHKTMNWRATR